mmetsp:Transcript_746/g.2043  ORF Transcript_746/g.2043 Transcript_746/m.2043 type:complete len:399 (-) Transcript_746:548-1744(-)
MSLIPASNLTADRPRAPRLPSRALRVPERTRAARGGGDTLRAPRLYRCARFRPAAAAAAADTPLEVDLGEGRRLGEEVVAHLPPCSRDVRLEAEGAHQPSNHGVQLRLRHPRTQAHARPERKRVRQQVVVQGLEGGSLALGLGHHPARGLELLGGLGVRAVAGPTDRRECHPRVGWDCDRQPAPPRVDQLDRFTQRAHVSADGGGEAVRLADYSLQPRKPGQRLVVEATVAEHLRQLFEKQLLFSRVVCEVHQQPAERVGGGVHPPLQQTCRVEHHLVARQRTPREQLAEVGLAPPRPRSKMLTTLYRLQHCLHTRRRALVHKIHGSLELAPVSRVECGCQRSEGRVQQRRARLLRDERFLDEPHVFCTRAGLGHDSGADSEHHCADQLEGEATREAL